MESILDDLKFTAPLTGITAAVVGVILNLALFFDWHTWWPRGAEGGFDAVAAGLPLQAAIALILFQRKVMHLIAACALLGLLAHSLTG